MKHQPAFLARLTALLCLPLASLSAYGAPQNIVVIDGTEYAIETVRKCEPHKAGAVTFELELQGLANTGGQRQQVDLSISSMSGMKMHSASWYGEKGVFGSQGMEKFIKQENGRVTGEATLEDSRDVAEPINMSFDLAVPEETYACR